jgi:RNA recognition motif-containing protein
MAKHKQQIAQKAKKNAQIRQKEAQKAEADSLSRKHLAGLRVVQKNLVYVTGLTPTIREDRLLDTLRGPDYFGQYGKIIKIVVSKARENAQHQQSVGVYVTFARKEDAEACITAVDGSQNGDRVLRYVVHVKLTSILACLPTTGRNTAPPNTAPPTSVASSATTATACFCTNPGRTTRASHDKICP